MRPEAMKAQVTLIQDVMKSVMRENEHYGKIPGCGDKPTLLQPGAQKLIMTFRLVPDPEVTVIDLPNEHREYRVKVNLTTQNGIFLGAGVGSCTTMEGKFRYRKADLACPECGKATIIKGKAEFGGGWLCYKNKGGCGKKWTDEENPFKGINLDRVEHDNPADYYNTCEKMAYKRALVSATLTVTAASDIFTQDIEDMPEVIKGADKPKEDMKPPQSKSAAPPDASGATEGKKEDTQGEVISEAQAKRFYAIAKGSNWTDEDIHKFLTDFYGIDSSRKILKAQYDEIIDIVKVKKDA
jgi:ssDNA-binding Zn-finger/Zn-ribbon topoisomerase 1